MSLASLVNRIQVEKKFTKSNCRIIFELTAAVSISTSWRIPLVSVDLKDYEDNFIFLFFSKLCYSVMFLVHMITRLDYHT